MKVRKLTNDGDYSFGSGRNNYVDGSYAVGQAIKTKVLMFYGEWWEDLGIGIPMFQSIVGQTDPTTIQNSLSLLLQRRISEIPEIKSIDSVNVNVLGRKISAVINVTDKNGDTSEAEVQI